MGMQQLRSIENNTPASATDVSFNFGTIETFVNNNLVNTDGSSVMTGQLVLAGNPTSDRHAAPKEYVDAVQPVGMIVDFAGATAPSGWLLCNGDIKNQVEYPALYAVCGATYNTGGEGGTQFRLPNFTDRSSVGTGANAVGATGGDADVKAHTHTASGGSHSHTGAAHTHDLRNHTHAGAAHTHTIAHNHTIDPPSTDGYSATGFKKGLVSVPVGSIGIASTSPGATGTWSINMPSFTSGGSSADNSGGRSASTSGPPSNNSTSSVTPGRGGAEDVAPTISSTGAGTDNYHPFLVVNKIIKAS